MILDKIIIRYGKKERKARRAKCVKVSKRIHIRRKKRREKTSLHENSS